MKLQHVRVFLKRNFPRSSVLSVEENFSEKEREADWRHVTRAQEAKRINHPPSPHQRALRATP